MPGGSARLTFRDEFDQSLDRRKWATNYTNVLASLPEELQIFTPDNFESSNGVLRIRTDQRAISGYKYSSGAMTTFGSFAQAYGYFEVRAKLPRGQGLWPGFWLLPEDKGWPPEIDIVEFLGGDVTTVYTTYHWLDQKKEHKRDGEGIKGHDWTADFHTYGVVWKPDLIAWYIDGKEVKRLTGAHVPKDRMFMILNSTVGGSWGGPPNSTTRFPAYFDIDYVRAYQFDGMPEPPPREYSYLTTIASKNVAKKGDEIEIDTGIRTSKENDLLRFQLLLVDAKSQKEIARRDIDVQPSSAGEVRRTWRVRIPPETPEGLYVVSFGLFDKQWKQIDWLNNATTILVQ